MTVFQPLDFGLATCLVITVRLLCWAVKERWGEPLREAGRLSAQRLRSRAAPAAAGWSAARREHKNSRDH